MLLLPEIPAAAVVVLLADPRSVFSTLTNRVPSPLVGGGNVDVQCRPLLLSPPSARYCLDFVWSPMWSTGFRVSTKIVVQSNSLRDIGGLCSLLPVGELYELRIRLANMMLLPSWQVSGSFLLYWGVAHQMPGTGTFWV